MQTLRRSPRSEQKILTQNLELLRQKSFDHQHDLLEDFSPKDLFQKSEEGVNSRDRIFSQTNTFFGFLHQCLSPDGSCQEAVHRIREQAQAQGVNVLPSTGTSAYVRARKRLILSDLKSICYHGAYAVLERAPLGPDERHWIGVDATGISMPDTPENQKDWPQPSNQGEGTGFPVLKMVGAFSLQTGALLDAEIGHLHEHEIITMRRMNETFEPDDILVGDRAYSNWYDIAILQEKQVDSVFRLSKRRKWATASTALAVLGEDDLLVEWERPKTRPESVAKDEWEGTCERIQLRQVSFQVSRPGFRTRQITVVTTLLDPLVYPKELLEKMYLRRWVAEVSFRDLKITLGGDILRCKTPAMIEKELWMHFIAYNALRYLQAMSAETCNVDLDRVSFKGCLEVFLTWEKRFRSARREHAKVFRQMLESICRTLLIKRPDRVEPRVVKRRTKQYSLMTKPREVLRQKILKAAAA